MWTQQYFEGWYVVNCFTEVFANILRPGAACAHCNAGGRNEQMYFSLHFLHNSQSYSLSMNLKCLCIIVIPWPVTVLLKGPDISTASKAKFAIFSGNEPASLEEDRRC